MIDPFYLEVLSHLATPLPWQYQDDKCFIDACAMEIKSGDICVASLLKLNDAKYIVTACNLLPELLKQNRDLRNGIRTPARWEEGNANNDYLWTCSACKNVSEASAAPRLYKYCPFCGAKMENENADR